MPERQTRRQQMIAQSRSLLNHLQSPAFFDYNETLTFEIADIEFEFTSEDLEESID